MCVQPATSTSDYSGASNGRGVESYRILGGGAKVEDKFQKSIVLMPMATLGSPG